MMPVIRVSETTFERLKSFARPFEDKSPEDVITRALDALEITAGRARQPRRSTAEAKAPIIRRSRSAQSEKLPQKALREPLLRVLLDVGGKASTQYIRERLEPMIRVHLNEADYEPVTSGDPRWWNAACWERLNMVKDALLRSDSPRGVWELTEQGRRQAQRGIQEEPADSSDGSWRADIEAALDKVDLGAGATLDRIYDEVRAIRSAAERSTPPSFEATVRRTLEDNSSDSDNYRGKDIFYMVEGKGRGVWGLRRKRRD
jgi:hypothetical protein